MATYNELVTRFSFEGTTAPLVDFNKLIDTMTDALASSHQAISDLSNNLSGASGDLDNLGESAEDVAKNVDKADESTLDFKTTLATTTAVIAGAVAGMAAWVGSVSDGIDPLIQMSRVTGESLENIQTWGYAASQNGSDVEAVSESMRELNLRMGEFARSGGGPAAEVMESYSLSVKDTEGNIKSASAMMTELNVVMQDLSQGERLDLLDKMGIDKSLVQLLGSSSEQIDGLRKKALALGVVTQAQGDQFAAYNDSSTTAKFGLESLSRTIAVGMTPALNSLTDSFVGFLIENQEFLQGAAKGIGNFFSGLIESFSRMAPVIAIATAAMTAYWLATGGAATAMAILMAPITGIIAGVTALYLIIDDLIVALNGGQSVIRDFFLEYWDFDIVPVIEDVIATVKVMFDYMMGIVQPLGDMFASMFEFVFAVFTGDGEAAAEAIKDIFSSLGEFIYNVLVQMPTDAFNYVSEYGAEFLENLKSLITGAFSAVYDFIVELFSALDIFGWFTDSSDEAIGSISKSFGNLQKWLGKLFDFDVFSGLTDSAGVVIGNISEISSTISETVSSALSSARDKVANLASSVGGFFSGLFDDAVELVSSEPAKALNTVETARARAESNTFNQPSYNQSQSYNQQNQINVYAQDSVEAGNEVNSQLNNQMKSARLASARGGF